MIDRLKKINLMDDGFYPLSVILTESFWVFPWLLWIGTWQMFSEHGPAISLGSLIVVLIVSLAVTRIVTMRNWPLWLIRSVVIGCGVITVFLVLRIEHPPGPEAGSSGWFGFFGETIANALNNPHPLVIALPVLVYLWWRGIVLGQTTSQFKDVYTSFIVGIVFLVALIIISQIASGGDKEALNSEIVFFVIAFFFFGLISMAVCHLSQMYRSMPREEAALTSVWRWLPMVLGAVGGLVGVGFLVATVFAKDLFRIVGQGAGYIGEGFNKVMDFLLVPLGWLFNAIMSVIQWFIDRFGNETEVTINYSAPPASEELTTREPVLSPEVITAIKWVIAALIVGLVVFILAKTVFRRLGRRDTEDIEEIHESLWNMKDIRDDFRLFFRSLGQKFRRKRGPALAGYPFEDNPEGRLDIRDIYRYLLWEGQRSGVPRFRQETVTEYARRLGDILPESAEPVNQVTDLYSRARYGEVPPPEERVDDANTLWRRVRDMLRNLRGDR